MCKSKRQVGATRTNDNRQKNTSASYKLLFQRRAAEESRDAFQIRVETFNSKFWSAHQRFCVVLKECAPVKVPAHDVHMQRHKRRHAVKSSLKCNWRLDNEAQRLNNGGGHEMHMDEKRCSCTSETSHCDEKSMRSKTEHHY
jgi:hypothetical protein